MRPARLAGDNRTQQEQNRARAQPGFALHRHRTRCCLALNNGDRVRGSSLNRSRNPTHDVKQPISFPRRISASGVCDFASPAPNRGVGGAPRNVRVRARHPWGVSCASQTRVNALMTRYARRLARRLASHNAGRSPLGAPPWRFFTRAALPSPALPPDPYSDLLAAGS